APPALNAAGRTQFWRFCAFKRWFNVGALDCRPSSSPLPEEITMPGQEVQQTINDINRQQPDRMHVLDEVRQYRQTHGASEYRQALNQINREANLTNLGFPSGSQLLGTLSDSFEVRNPQGRVQYVSGESGQTVRTADVTQVRTNMERQFHQRPDGG